MYLIKVIGNIVKLGKKTEQNKHLACTFTDHIIFRNMFIFWSFYQKPGDHLSARKGKERMNNNKWLKLYSKTKLCNIINSYVKKNTHIQNSSWKKKKNWTSWIQNSSEVCFSKCQSDKINFNVSTYNPDNSGSNCYTYHDEGVQAFKGPLLILLNLWSTHTHGPLWVQKPVLWIQQGEIIKENTSKLCGRRQGINKLWPTTNPQPQTNTETEGHDWIYSRYQPTQL